MEALETIPPSWRTRLWARLVDLEKSPRCWWFPPSSRRDAVLQMSEAARQDYHKVVQQAHEKFSETVRLAMLSVLGFALFCLLITFGTPDSAHLIADPTIKIPFLTDVPVSFQSFVILAPFLLIVVTLYLHIFYGYWLDLERDYQHLTRSRESHEPSMERLPTLFSLDHPVPRLLTAFIFYGLVPLVLLTITWKAAARLEWGLPLALITSLVTAILFFLQIRRRPAFRRQRNRPLWVVMGLILGCMAAIMLQFMAQLPRPTEVVRHRPLQPKEKEAVVVPQWLLRPFNIVVIMLQFMARPPRSTETEVVVVPQWLPRPLNIFHADLKGKWLAEVNLRGAYASFVNFESAELERANLQRAKLYRANLQRAKLQRAWLMDVNLWEANLQGAELRDATLGQANLQGANLKEAELQHATLQSANLQEADLRWADLQHATLRDAQLQRAKLRGANLQGAELQGANLRGANLEGADLRGVTGLTPAQLQAAQTNVHTQLPDTLQRPRPRAALPGRLTK